MSNQHQFLHLLPSLQNPPYCSPLPTVKTCWTSPLGEMTASSAGCLSRAGQRGTAQGQTLHHHLPLTACSQSSPSRPFWSRCQCGWGRRSLQLHTWEVRNTLTAQPSWCRTTLQLLVCFSSASSGQVKPSVSFNSANNHLPAKALAEVRAEGPLTVGVWGLNSCLPSTWPWTADSRLASQHLLLTSSFSSNIFSLLIQPISNNK